jgi:DNA-binding CsgD family transcriptional regulator
MGRELTPRERELLLVVRAGAHSYRAIAARLGVSPRTAQDLVYSASRKLEPISSRPLVRVILTAHLRMDATPL